MRRPATILAALTLATLPALSGASLIRPTSATASSQFSSTYRPENAINGSGLPDNFTPADAHAPYTDANGGNHWTTAAGTTPTTAWISFEFDTPQTLGTLYLWNHRSTTPLAANSGYDVTRFNVSFFAPDGITHLLSLGDVPLDPDVATAQAISFPRIGGVGRVRLAVTQVQSSNNYTGLAEVAFDQGFIAGDATGDGVVNLDDFAAADRGRAKGLRGWTNGDFNADRTVDARDYLILDLAYARTQPNGTPSPALLAQRQADFGPAYVSELLTALPEPSALAASLLTFPLLRRRPRRLSCAF